MRTTISVDDKLYEEALAYAGDDVSSPADLVREAIKTYVQVQAGKRLAALGGSAPQMPDIPRRGEPA
ncbi:MULTISPECIES: type II toxin-antitoxin system VapB family antitoxin [unclassified Halomonas]|uniref:type II toxin-antitoxin system VapB family antitoxin n=1 Tax=unclassified Halomonas TaxID=2609666 RepID=UPI003F90C7D6